MIRFFKYAVIALIGLCVPSLAKISIAEEIKQIYLGYRGCTQSPTGYCFVTVGNGVESYQPLGANFLCSGPGGFLILNWNYFLHNYNIDTPVYIVKVDGHVFDTQLGGDYEKKFFSLQRQSDEGFLTYVKMYKSLDTYDKNNWAGYTVKLDPTDSILLESSCQPDNARTVAVSIWYKTTP